MIPAADDPFNLLDNESPGLQISLQNDLVLSLLYQISRVKELIKYQDSIPNSMGKLNGSVLNELVSEAYDSLINYDVLLMKKYFDLLQDCD